MAKIILSLVLVVAVAAILCQAEPAQRAQQQQQQRRPVRYTRPRNRFLARQEEAPATVDEAAVTPYPSADELKPEVPFEEAEVPAGDVAAEPIPDEVYGPPESDQSYNQPDEVYGPPEVNENDLPAEDAAAETFPAPLDEQQARLVAARRGNLRRKAAYRQAAYRKAVSARAVARPAKLRAAPVVRRAA